MKKQEMQRLLALVGRLTKGQRLELVDKLKTQSNVKASIEVVESACSQRTRTLHTGTRTASHHIGEEACVAFRRLILTNGLGRPTHDLVAGHQAAKVFCMNTLSGSLV